MKAIFLSDIHLQDAHSEKAQAVLSFLNEKSAQFPHVFILGDLFDVWPGTSNFLVSTFKPVMEVFKALVQKGCQLHYIEGNHDFRLGKYFESELGVKVYTDSYEFVSNNKKIFLTHGDLGNPEEKSYRVLRKLLRAEWLHWMIKPVPKKWVYLLGQKTSQASRGYQTMTEDKKNCVRDIYRTTATQLFTQGYDVVVMGHTHIPDDFVAEVGNRKCRYLNTGDWVKNFTYLEFDGIEFYTKRHSIG